MPTNVVTKLASDMAIGDRFCSVENTAQLPDEGNIVIGSEYVSYTNKMTQTINELKRGLRGSIRKSHKKGTLVILVDEFNPINDLYARVFDRLGEDIFLNADGDIFVSEGGDIKVSKGIETLDVRLRIRVNSSLGIGINNEVGVAPDLGVVEERVLATNVANAVSQDPDVSRVENVSTVRDGDVLIIVMNVFVRGLSDAVQFSYKIVDHIN